LTILAGFQNENLNMAEQIKERRRGRPVGSKNKVKKANGSVPQAEKAIRIPGTFLCLHPKYHRLINRWSKDTKIGMQQIFDDIILAGASAAYKSFYRGLINSRKAAEEQFDAETNPEAVVRGREPEQVERNGSVDRTNPPSVERRIVERREEEPEQLSLVAERPGHLEETSPDFGETTGVIDAPPDPEETDPDEEEEDGDQPPL
jgi:hypothetical protein